MEKILKAAKNVCIGDNHQRVSTWDGLTGITVVLLVLAGLFMMAAYTVPWQKMTVLGSKAKYDFEKGIMGWKAQNYKDSQACFKVSHSKGKSGSPSLEMHMDLIGGDDHKSKGEAWVEMTKNPPAGVRAPVNMTNRTITAWVYAPRGAAGERSDPNGFQVFVKDDKWKNEYGTWHHVEEGQWSKITLTVSPTQPDGGYMNDGFNPAKIIAVGVKMGAGGGSSARFKGSVYVNKVDW